MILHKLVKCQRKCWLPIFLLALLLQSCNVTQFLDRDKGEKLLTKSAVKIEVPQDGKLEGQSNLTYELSNLALQKPNRRFFGTSRAFLYYAATDTIDRSRIGMAFLKWLSKRAELPAILDAKLAAQSAMNMQAYLQDRGYFFAEVSPDIKFNRWETKATVTYFVEPDGRFLIDTLVFECRDSAVTQLLNERKDESLIRAGKPVDVKLYDQEVGRITRLLRNEGYTYFYPQYITSLEGFDSSNVEKTVSIKLKVLTPTGRDFHQKYTVGNIYLYPDYYQNGPAAVPDTLVDGVFFATGGRPMQVRPQTLANSIFFRTGSTYSQDAVDNSIRQLGGLGVFRPPSLRLVEDTLHPGVMNFEIQLLSNKKWELGVDWDVNTTQRTGVVGARNLIGPTLGASLRNRNFLKGAELLIGNLNAGIELAPFSGRENIVNSFDFRIQGDLFFPRFADYLGIWKKASKWGITSPNFNQNLRQKANSHLSTSYNMLLLLDNYQLHFANLSYGFQVPVSVNHQATLHHFGIDLVLPIIKPLSRFDSLLQQTPSLQNSFAKQLITGFLFRDLEFVYTSPPKGVGSSWYFRGYLDVSGLEVMAANAIYNELASEAKTFNIIGLDFSHYGKLELDGRRNWQYRPNKSLQLRVNCGIALPYYRSSEVPFVKQFFVGGPYSIRGWYARELGPGLYRDPLTDTPSNRNLFYQSGDVKIEFNLEYRFLLMRPFGLFNMYSALFLDGGNIWTLGKDPDRPGSQLALTRATSADGLVVQDNFVREMALATGFGTRFDFTYFILRLDLGTPVRNNYPDPSRNQLYWFDFSKWNRFNIRYQLALGYPF